MHRLSLEQRKARQESPGQRPFGENTIGRGGVHIDEALALPYADQVQVRLAARFVDPLYQHPCAGHQQFPAAAGILHVADLEVPVQLHVGDKAIGAVYEDRPRYVGVCHWTSSWAAASFRRWMMGMCWGHTLSHWPQATHLLATPPWRVSQE